MSAIHKCRGCGRLIPNGAKCPDCAKLEPIHKKLNAGQITFTEAVILEGEARKK